MIWKWVGKLASGAFPPLRVRLAGREVLSDGSSDFVITKCDRNHSINSAVVIAKG
jgi:hypothetical protein